MTTTVRPESNSPSRRAMLAGALGGLGALVVSAIGRASPVQAANGDPVLMGFVNEATGNTIVSTTGVRALVGISSSTGADTVFGQATAPTGEAWGVRGESSSTGGSGVVGKGLANSGLSYGVQGHSNSSSGVGVYARNDSTGLALQTSGRTKFSTSGVAVMVAGATSKKVIPSVNVTSSSFVLLTPKTNIGSRALWFTTSAADNYFTIRMSSPRSSTTRVAWLLLG
jgi:hypothetical protein